MDHSRADARTTTEYAGSARDGEDRWDLAGVIRRVAVERDRVLHARVRMSVRQDQTVTATNRATLRRWLLLALLDMGGSSARRELHNHIASRFGSNFTAEDTKPRRGNEPSWRNNLDSLYDILKREGVMEPSSLGAAWRLSPSGRSEARTYRDAFDAYETELHAFSDFYPKDDSDYLTQISAREMRKTRAHETVLKAYGEHAAGLGWRPSTRVHPRDLELTKRDEKCLVEVKVVAESGPTRACREALAQLLEYSRFFYDEQPMMLGVFSSEIPGAYVELLEEHRIASAWRSKSGWSGSSSARSAGLC